MATITKGRTWVSGETVTPEKLNAFLDSAVVTPGTVATADLADAAVTGAKMAAGAVVQTVTVANAAYGATSVVIPLDDTPPLIGEGTEILTVSITPAASANKVLARVCLPQVSAAAANSVIVSLFRGSSCIGSCVVSIGGAGLRAAAGIEVLDAPATTGATTYSVRFGAVTAGNVFVNGNSGRALGGTSVCSLVLHEIKG